MTGSDGGWARIGRVTTFDEARGLGEITDAQGTIVPFHCVAIADGSRSIDEGAEVDFELGPGGMGRWEARNIRSRS